ncbi:hypothetical protein JCM3765_002962 [Sporobolomyces pararoseus]
MPSSKNESPLVRAASVLSRSTSKIKFFKSLSPIPTRPSSLSPSPSPSPSRFPSPPPVDEPSPQAFIDALDKSVSHRGTTRTSTKREARESDCNNDPTPPSLFTNLNPFASLPVEIGSAPSSPKHPRLERRHSSELRAIAANKLRQECAQVTFRRQSLVELDVVTDRLRSRRLSSLKGERRRSSTSRRRRSSAAPRGSFSLEAGPRRSISPTESHSSRGSTTAPSLPFVPFTDRRHAFSNENPQSSFSLNLPSSENKPLATQLRRRSPLQIAIIDPLDPPIRHYTSASRPRLDLSESEDVEIDKSPLPFYSSEPSTRSPSLSTSLQTRTDTDDSEFETPLEDDIDSFPGVSSSLLQFSPQPPTRNRRSSIHPHALSHSRSPPFLHLDLASLSRPASRRVSTASSYHRPSPDHDLLTPGTICLFPTPSYTSRSYHATEDIFAASFGGALKTNQSD